MSSRGGTVLLYCVTVLTSRAAFFLCCNKQNGGKLTFGAYSKGKMAYYVFWKLSFWISEWNRNQNTNLCYLWRDTKVYKLISVIYVYCSNFLRLNLDSLKVLQNGAWYLLWDDHMLQSEIMLYCNNQAQSWWIKMKMEVRVVFIFTLLCFSLHAMWRLLLIKLWCVMWRLAQL